MENQFAVLKKKTSEVDWIPIATPIFFHANFFWVTIILPTPLFLNQFSDFYPNKKFVI